MRTKPLAMGNSSRRCPDLWPRVAELWTTAIGKAMYCAAASRAILAVMPAVGSVGFALM